MNNFNFIIIKSVFKENYIISLIDDVKYYEFYAPKKFGLINLNSNSENKTERMEIRSIIERERPDIIHIWGSEYYHALMALEENTIKAKTVCSIQGLTGEIAKYYLEYIPSSIYHKLSVSCIIRGTLAQQRRNLINRGSVEKIIIEKCKNFIGRTAWDEAVIKSLNPHCMYYKCNETLRDSFYKVKWRYEGCCPETLFISQGSSPLKGLNVAIEALYILKKYYPNIRLYVAGSNFIKCDTLKEKLSISTYGIFIKKLIDKYNLNENIRFTGPLDEEKMTEQYLKCNIFLSCSSIENSSNSVCEAMLLGVPIVASYVGGVTSLMDDKVHGLMYQGNSPVMLAFSIDKLLKMKESVSYFGLKAREKAYIRHNPYSNNKRLIEIYRKILGEGEVIDKY